MNLRQNNRSVFVTERVRALFNRFSAQRIGSERTDVRKHLQDIYEGFKSLYTSIGKPTVKYRPFDPKDIPRSNTYNRTMQEIESDLELAYNETESLGHSFVETFNYANSLSKELDSEGAKASSKVVDLRILGGQFDQNMLIAGDDFNDLSKVDQTAPAQNSRADVNTAQGIATLNRLESENLVNQNVTIKVEPVGPRDLTKNPTVGNVDRFYEGNFYDFVNRSRPEGGYFHFEEYLASTVKEQGISRKVVNTSGGLGSQQDIQNLIAAEAGDSGGGRRIKPQDILVIERGASEPEKEEIRINLVDNNPATFWECEYVVTDLALQDIVEDGRAVSEGGTFSQKQLAEGEEVINNLDVTPTLNDLRTRTELTTAGSDDDLIIEITVTLDSPGPVNWISINPNNFNETAWTDVLDISYSDDSSSAFSTIPGFANDIHDNILTDHANAEITSEEQSSILAPDRYSYKGLGVWSFEAVTARIIKIRLRQRTGVPDPYQRLAIRLHRTFRQTFTTTSMPTPGM